VIEQSSDGTVRCESGKRASKAATAPEAARERPAAEKPAAEKPAERPAEPRPARSANDAPGDPRHGNRQRRTSTLEWKATRDAGFDGFLARSGSGQFKVLFNRTWALFFERRNELPERLGCYKNLDNAKEKAQRLHDRGMRESELTPDQVNTFCPPEGALDDPPPRAERRVKPEPEPAPEAVPAAERKAREAPPPRSDESAAAEDDAIKSLRKHIDSLVSDDEDD